MVLVLPFCGELERTWVGQAFEQGTVEIEIILKPADHIHTFMLD